MDKRLIELIHLCLNELYLVKQIIDLKISDDFTSRLLGIYTTMRIDDITKIWSHNIPKDSESRQLVDKIKNQYNQWLRPVRDKLGAHYQKIADYDCLFNAVKLFNSIDYANTVCLIDEIFDAESKIEKTPIKQIDFQDKNDINIIKKVIKALYSDDQAHITNGTLDIFGINKGGLMATTEGQIKAQHLRSIEVMISIAHNLFEQQYANSEVKRMFKRLYVSLIYNYHDNLITRTDIAQNAAQYEKGFDILFLNLISKQDDKNMLENAFVKFENIYHISNIIKKNRNVRNIACAHFDENSSVKEINNELDLLNVEELKKAYSNMLLLFNFICNNVFCLKMLALPARSPIYGAQMKTTEGNENFYGESVQTEIPQEMNCVEIMRSIRQNSDRYEEAKDMLQRKLMSANIEVYKEIETVLFQRLRESSISAGEMATIIQSLHNARSGYPERLQRTLVNMLGDDAIFNNCNGHLLWLLSFICREDAEIDVPALLDSVIKQRNIIAVTLSLLAFLHMTVEKVHSCIVRQNKAHDVSKTFRDYCDSIKNQTEKCAAMLSLSQHWFHGTEYSFYRVYEENYSNFLLNETSEALQEYLVYAKVCDKDRELCERYLNTRHYLLLLNNLAALEKGRKQKDNVFLNLWRHNCFIRLRCDLYESIAVGYLTEQEGNKVFAKAIFDSIVQDYPINEEAISAREFFYKRNPNMR